jgi:hypothetical protein
MEVKCFSKAIWILSPSTTMPCSLRGTVVEALHNPTVEANIMFEFLAETLLGKIPLVLKVWENCFCHSLGYPNGGASSQQ